MKKRIVSALAAACLIILGLILSTPATASTAAPQDCKYQVASRFLGRYDENPGAYGCATTPEVGYDAPHAPGSAQDFVHGAMEWSPNQGNDMIVSMYSYPNGSQIGLHVEWGGSYPFGYGGWLIRHDTYGTSAGVVNIGQTDCTDPGARCAYTYYDPKNGWESTEGFIDWSSVPYGGNQIEVEGCDPTSTGGHSCRQSWTTSAELWVYT